MEDTDVNIAKNYPHEAKRLRVILGITVLFLCVGLVAPIITLTRFVLIENTFSVLSGVIELFKEGQIFLFVVITGFSIVLPLLKISVLNKLLSVKDNKAANLDKYLHWMRLYGKWSMLDVFVVAVLVVAMKLRSRSQCGDAVWAVFIFGSSNFNDVRYCKGSEPGKWIEERRGITGIRCILTG